ncbi:MAG: acyltransferase [Bacteroidetes bacterium]|nr:acyltransferase [Bacteroidota bacterium]
MEERLRLVQVRTFYMRRILRIWPLYYTYMVGSGLLLWHFGEQIDWPAVGLSALLFANLSPLLSLSPMLIFHYWSLGVEEQFYLFYPWLFRLRRWRWHIISGLCLLFIGLNGWLVVSFGGKHGPHTSYKIHYAYLLIGALGAGAYHRGWHRFFLHRSIQLGTWLLLGVMAAYTTPLHSFIWVHELLACFTVLLIWGQATGRGIISLEWRPLRFLGRISFGIYILHPAVIFVVTRYWRVLGYTSWIDYACVFGLIFGLTILLASLSYQYLEAPFLRMKRHYA